ncbi:MAG TPA: fatty acid cis/trans isomerase, partial [Polyangiales bacterium]
AAHAKDEAIDALLRGFTPEVAGPREPIQWRDVPLSHDPLRARFEVAMRPAMNAPGPYVTVFPDTLLLRVKSANAPDLVYTLARNRSHKSVEFIFLEGVELEPEEDTLQIVSGILTSRPNLFLHVEAAQLDAFAMSLRALSPKDASWRDFVAKYGVRRSDPTFWETFDFFADAFKRLDPIGAAVLDLSHYSND